MANQKPSKILELSGAYKKNPSRKRPNEPEPTEPIGECPDYMSNSHKIIWDEIVKNCVDGVLTVQDRHALELVVYGYHDVRYGVEVEGEIKKVGGAERDRVFKQMGKFGMTPVDRANVQVPDKPKADSGFGTL